MSRKSGYRFSEKDMRQRKKAERIPIHSIGIAPRGECMRFRLRMTAVLTLLAAAFPAWAQAPEGRFGNPGRFVPQSGEGLYADLCQACHMPGGVGAVGAGAYPPLASDPKLASGGFALAMVIRGQKAMPPFGGVLTDEQVAAVVNYIRGHFGNHFADEVTAGDAKAAR
jgi:mono/diheme cytochrome c family protein